MTERALTDEERSLICAIVSTTKDYDAYALQVELAHATMTKSSTWVCEVRAPDSTRVFGCSDGPFPARAFVSEGVEYQGEIIIWITSGHLSGLEYAWVTDQPPTRWPRPDELVVHPA
ncbi:hypothetical protein [Mycobacterium kyogaense]|uniref:hypothetical protein n=1 Tax=Mycobacterium kyogaense TaxID=2212479 RepID=UPI000DAB7440|nr:hypothetical protein [Mycobacterium kyogaense]